MSQHHDDHRLSAFIDARLGSRELRRLHASLQESPERWTEILHLRWVVDGLKRLRERHPEPPAEFWDETFTRLRHFARTEACTASCRERLAFGARTLAVMLALLGVLSLGAQLWAPSSRPTSAQTLQVEHAARSAARSPFGIESWVTLAGAGARTAGFGGGGHR